MSSEGPTQIFPEPRPELPPAAVLDIFFVHGLGGDRLETWQKTRDAFWPRWLVEEFPTCRVYMIGYDSNKFAGFLSGEGASIQDLALAMADQIASREEGAPHALLVAHSLGGLIVKQMLRRCTDSMNPDFNGVGRSVTGVVFLGTPHQGAHAATTLDVLLGLFKSKQVKQLAYSDDTLIDLNEFFRSWVSRQGAAVRTFYETEKTGGVHIVDKVTANPGIAGSDPIAVQANHIDICKPASKTAPVYASMCAMIRQLLNKIAPASVPGTGGLLGSNGVGSAGGVQGTGGLLGSNGVGSAGGVQGSGTAVVTEAGLTSEVLADFVYYTTTADHDRRDLAQKLADAGRSYAIADAKRKKERFNMALQRHIAQPSAVTRYTQLMADVESRFNRHVARVVADQADGTAVDQVVQDQVIGPCTATHSSSENEITAGLVDGALYYLAGNCHLAWDNG
jgi:pimeloyl-ACP methyl ester carboxylesterase